MNLQSTVLIVDDEKHTRDGLRSLLENDYDVYVAPDIAGAINVMDRDQIDVGRSEGRFRQIEIRVKDAPIEISDMVVTVGNNETFKPKLQHKFAEGSGSRIIDLPGERRIIKRIDFNYKSISRREGKGMVEVFAR